IVCFDGVRAEALSAAAGCCANAKQDSASAVHEHTIRFRISSLHDRAAGNLTLPPDSQSRAYYTRGGPFLETLFESGVAVARVLGYYGAPRRMRLYSGQSHGLGCGFRGRLTRTPNDETNPAGFACGTRLGIIRILNDGAARALGVAAIAKDRCRECNDLHSIHLVRQIPQIATG